MADVALTIPEGRIEGSPPLSPNSTAVETLEPSFDATHTSLRPHGRPPFRATLREDSHIIHYGDKREQENSKFQIAWEQNSRNGKKSESSYERAAVLLISWDIKCDDLKTKDEVNSLSFSLPCTLTVKQVERLERVFRDSYHYRVRKVLLTSTGKLPQVQTQWHVSNFVMDEDGPQTLLIVYYAGHGTPGSVPGQLELSGWVCYRVLWKTFS